MSRDCCVALPHDAMGLSAVYDYGISENVTENVKIVGLNNDIHHFDTRGL